MGTRKKRRKSLGVCCYDTCEICGEPMEPQSCPWCDDCYWKLPLEPESQDDRATTS